MPRSNNPRRYSSVSSLIKKNNKTVTSFSTEAQTLFRLLELIVDIKYRKKYGHTLGYSDSRYGNQEQQKKVVADQISLVDNISPIRQNSTEDIW